MGRQTIPALQPSGGTEAGHTELFTNATVRQKHRRKAPGGKGYGPFGSELGRGGAQCSGYKHFAAPLAGGQRPQLDGCSQKAKGQGAQSKAQGRRSGAHMKRNRQGEDLRKGMWGEQV
eukprot:EG_transcript_30920